jgi:hypothetical protein
MKKCLILATVTALLMSGCASITTVPNNDEVIDYENDHSLAWNVMNQIESADKLYDVTTPDGDSVKDTSALGHVAFAVLSGNFFGGLTASVLTDNKGHITHANMIQSLDLRNAPKGDLKLEVTNQFIARLKAADNTTIIEGLKVSSDGYSFIERSDSCTRVLKAYLEMRPDSDTAKSDLKNGYCKIILDIDVVGPSNLDVFKGSEEQTTIRIRPNGNRHANTFIETFNDTYLFHAAFQYPGRDVVSAPFVEYKGSAYLFMQKTDNGKEQFIPFSEMPDQKYLMLGR